MMDQIGFYLVSVTAASLICGIIGKLIGKKGTIAVVVKMMCGVFMVITVVSPLFEIHVYDFSDYMESFSQQAEAAAELGAALAQDNKQTFISEKVCSYILDKAASMGLAVSVSVELTEEEPFVPRSAEIVGNASQTQKEILVLYIENELGISREDQLWIE